MKWWVTVLVYAGMALILLGPALGTYLPICNARTPAARRFLIRVAAGMWAVLLIFVVLPTLLAYHGVLDWATVAGSSVVFFMFPAIPWINRRV